MYQIILLKNRFGEYWHRCGKYKDTCKRSEELSVRLLHLNIHFWGYGHSPSLKVIFTHSVQHRSNLLSSSIFLSQSVCPESWVHYGSPLHSNQGMERRHEILPKIWRITRWNYISHPKSVSLKPSQEDGEVDVSWSMDRTSRKRKQQVLPDR